jgi:hypothetical protein
LLPLSYAQQRLWFLDQLEPNGAIYNISAALRMARRLGVAAPRAAANALVARHENLRTRVEVSGGQPEQVIAPELTLGVRLEDLSHLPSH